MRLLTLLAMLGTLVFGSTVLRCDNYEVAVADTYLEATALGDTYIVPLLSESALTSVYGWSNEFVLVFSKDTLTIDLFYYPPITTIERHFNCSAIKGD